MLASKVNLLKLPMAAVMTIGNEPCLVVPIKRNDLYMSADEQGNPKAVFLDLVHFDIQDSKYGDSHMIKQSHSQEWNESHSEEQRRAEPIIGNTKTMKAPEVNVEKLPNATDPNKVSWEDLARRSAELQGLPFQPAIG